MQTITFIEEDEVKREQHALEIISHRNRFNSPFLADWVLKALANGKIAESWIKEKARIMLNERANGIWRTPSKPLKPPKLFRSSKKSKTPKPPKPLKPGYVYLIKASNGLFKIGKAENIKGRLKALNGMCACKLELIYAIYSDRPYALEKKLHKQYAQAHSHGEWFTLTSDDVEEIKNTIG